MNSRMLDVWHQVAYKDFFFFQITLIHIFNFQVEIDFGDLSLC